MTTLQKINALNWFDFLRKIKEILIELLNQGGGSESSYKVYSALLTQENTDDPIATVLENTLGGELVWQRDAIGSYTGELAGAFLEGKTFAFTGGLDYPETANNILIRRTDSDTIAIQTAINDELADTSLTAVSVEIRVYN